MRAKRLEMTSDQVSMGLKSAVWTPRAASIAKKTNPHVSGVAAPVEYFRSLLVEESALRGSKGISVLMPRTVSI